MKKFLIIAMLCLFFTPGSYAQMVLKGVAKSNFQIYQKGDTLDVYGMKSNPMKENEQYLVKGEYGDTYVSSKKLELVNPPSDYWENEWFRNNAAELRKKGWETDRRQMLREDALDYYLKARDNDLIFEDELLYDYLYRLVHRIHPEKLIKDQVSNLAILVIKSTEKSSFAFDNGLMVLTTGMIAHTQSEKELLEILANNIAHILLEHNLSNLNQLIRAERRANLWATIGAVSASVAMTYSNEKYGSTFDAYHALDVGLAAHFFSSKILQAIGAEYSREQINKAKLIAENYLHTHPYPEISEEEYLIEISGAISYTAWQEYHLMNYDKALGLINKLYHHEIATEEDYLLLSKLSRKLSNSPHSNAEALAYLIKARSVGLTNLVDLEKEAGLLYLRMKDYENAKLAFHKYREGLMELEKGGHDIASDLKYVNQVMYKYQMLD